MTAAAVPLEAAGVVCRYGRQEVLHGVSLAVRPGEIVGLIGLNGAGKTTLIKAVVDLGALSAGTVRLFGDPHRDSASRRRIAYLPEQFTPSPYLKGWEFLDLSLSYYGLRLARDQAAAAGFDLDPAVLRRRVTTYSKGMGQKLGLLGTLLTERPLLLLDEPMSGLDPRARILLKDALLAYRGRGHSILLSSHILSDIDELCDSIAVLHDGRMLYSGTPAGLRDGRGEASLERAFLRAIERPMTEVTASMGPGAAPDPTAG